MRPRTVTADTTAPSVPHNESTMSLRLSSRQITLLLSFIWAHSISPLNTPENYQAIAHTYSLVLLYAWTKGIPEQRTDKECGYFIMRYMKDIAEDKNLDFFSKWERRGKAAYTQHHIDAIRTEWAKFVVKTYM